jgi:hypothetical protein
MEPKQELEEELAYVRLNILLAKDALFKLDALKDRAGLASRGRTLQELIDTIWELQHDTKAIMNILQKNPTIPSGEFIQTITPFLTDILRRVWRFEKQE